MLDHEQSSRILNDIRKKWENAEQLVINCDPKSVYALSEIDVLLEKHKFEKYKEHQHGNEWRVLSEDQEIIKKEFVTNCICKKKGKK